jgi:hypothetical protein
VQSRDIGGVFLAEGGGRAEDGGQESGVELRDQPRFLRPPCPGYVKDHIVPLACRGPDTVANLQWQTAPDARAKDKWERERCFR